MRVLSRLGELRFWRWHHWLIAAGVVALVGAGVLLIGIQRWYSTSLQALQPGATHLQTFVVRPGLTALEIGDQLEEAELIRSSTAFLWYTDRSGLKAKLQAGTYRLGPGMTVQDISDHLTKGLVDNTRVTVLPGLRLDQVEKLLINEQFSTADIKAALEANYDHPLLAKKPRNSSLEGYLYPDTYHIDGSSTAKGFVSRVLDHFYEQITPQMKRGFAKQNLTLHEAIILASIVQRESSNPEEQRKIAQVFLKRLRTDMVLGSDVTFIYAAALSGQPATPDLDSPYNTRIHGGLPPGPIGNFNLSALEAVAFPANTDWLYFVAGDDGVIYYSKTNEGHEANVNAHCHEGCQ